VFDLAEVVRRWQRCYLNSEDLPEIAYRAIEAGHDCPELYELAGLDHPNMAEAGPLFARALDGLGQISATIKSAPLVIAALVAQRILDGELGIIAGSREMVSIRNHGNLIDDEGLLPFVALESDTETLPLGPVRVLWSAGALAEADIRIAQIEASCADIHDACRALIARAFPSRKT